MYRAIAVGRSRSGRGKVVFATWVGLGVGQANINMTRAVLDAVRVRAHVCDVGGMCGRKILFNTLSGRVLLKYLDSASKRVVALDR